MKLRQLHEAFLSDDEELNEKITTWMKDFANFHGKFSYLHGKIYTSSGTVINLRDLNLKELPYPFGRTGSFTVSGNLLKSFDKFPEDIRGELCINHNRFTSFEGIPKVSGAILAISNQIKTFKGLPDTFPGRLMVARNLFQSFEFCPKKIMGGFSVSYNKISSLQHAPERVEGSVWMGENKFTSLHDIHKHFKYINGTLDIGGNPIKSHILGVLLIDGLKDITDSGGDTESSKELFKAVGIVRNYIGKGKSGVIECQEELIDADLEDFAEL